MSFKFPHRVVHGGVGKRLQEKTQKNVLDFSASVNPLPPGFSWDRDSVDIFCYPDDDYAFLKERIAHTFKRKPEEICVGNGSIELIRVFAGSVCRRGKNIFTRPPRLGNMTCLPASRGPCLPPRQIPRTSILSATRIIPLVSCSPKKHCFFYWITAPGTGACSSATKHLSSSLIPRKVLQTSPAPTSLSCDPSQKVSRARAYGLAMVLGRRNLSKKSRRHDPPGA